MAVPLVPVQRASALGDDEEEEVDEQHGIVQPQRDEHYEPGPSRGKW